jgi:hypothetical protein
VPDRLTDGRETLLHAILVSRSRILVRLVIFCSELDRHTQLDEPLFASEGIVTRLAKGCNMAQLNVSPHPPRTECDGCGVELNRGHPPLTSQRFHLDEVKFSPSLNRSWAMQRCPQVHLRVCFTIAT